VNIEIITTKKYFLKLDKTREQESVCREDINKYIINLTLND
jgi:hypothetical protein